MGGVCLDGMEIEMSQSDRNSASDPDGGGRRKGNDRRQEQVPFEGPDRRKGDRRSAENRRKGERRSGIDRRGEG